MRVFILIFALLFNGFAFAQTSADDVEVRARDVGRSLRCVVCQNQSIEESDASLAKDMRRLVRDRMSQGDSDAEVIEFMRSRYGDYVLLKPPVQSNTYLLWLLPFLTVFAMALWLVFAAQKKRIFASDVDELSDEEQTVLDQLMDKSS